MVTTTVRHSPANLSDGHHSTSHRAVILAVGRPMPETPIDRSQRGFEPFAEAESPSALPHLLRRRAFAAAFAAAFASTLASAFDLAAARTAT